MELPCTGGGFVQCHRKPRHNLEPASDAICASFLGGSLKTGRGLRMPTHMTAGCHGWSYEARDLLSSIWKGVSPRWESFLRTLTDLETPIDTFEFKWCVNLNTPADVQGARALIRSPSA